MMYLDKAREYTDKDGGILIRSVDLVDKGIDIIILKKVTISSTQNIYCILDYGCCFLTTSHL